MSVEHWRNDNDREKPKYLERKRSVPLCAFYPHGLGSNWGLRGERGQLVNCEMEGMRWRK